MLCNGNMFCSKLFQKYFRQLWTIFTGVIFFHRLLTCRVQHFSSVEFHTPVRQEPLQLNMSRKRSEVICKFKKNLWPYPVALAHLETQSSVVLSTQVPHKWVCWTGCAVPRQLHVTELSASSQQGVCVRQVIIGLFITWSVGILVS